MSSGIKYAKGTFTIIMDGDMQNPNNAIVDIFNILSDNKTDIVYTVSEDRNNLQNKLSSKLFWYLINKIFKLNFVPNQLMMKGFNSKFKDVFNLYNEKNRFVAGITKDIGLRTNILRVRNNKRDFGKSNYNFTKRFFLMIDIILSITEKPLNMIISFSIILLILSAFYSLYTIFNYFYFPNMPRGYPTLMILISFFGSLNLLVLGIISKYLSFINSEVKNRPLFTVENIINM
jgi:dolichol-phosphate mannosyltransferase